MTSVYSLMTGERNASNYYRQRLPLAKMEQLKLPMELLSDNFTAAITMPERFQAMTSADIAFIYHTVSPAYADWLGKLNEMSAMRDSKGEIRYPPCVICDTDDDIFTVLPTNPSFGEIGTQINGVPLKPGCKVKMTDSAGRVVTMWEDGKNFSLEANNIRVDAFRKLLSISGLVTCSTPGAERYVKREVPNANTYIFPNCVAFDEYPTIDLRQRRDDDVYILWQGGDSHFADLLKTKNTLIKVAQKYPNVKWIVFGQRYKWFQEAFENCDYIPWVPYDAYKLRLSTIGHDINLCPLVDNTFNNAKSAIKFYESSVISRPAATLAQNTEPYREIIEGETGLLWNNNDELYEKLCGLIEDAHLRRTLANNARDWVRTNRDINDHVVPLFHRWVDALTDHRIARPVVDVPTDKDSPGQPAAPLASGDVTYSTEEADVPAEQPINQ